MNLRSPRLLLTFTSSADVINVSGHRLGSAEIESALVAHPSVAEAAVIGYPHDIKGCVATAALSIMRAAELLSASPVFTSVAGLGLQG
jgi:acyl-coenzyme A synthetase/AMP-(fatty) acid ligase